MKNLKRFLTLFLALSMVLSALSMTAFAAAGDPGTIKKVEIEADYDGVVTTDAKDGDVNFALNYSEATENGMYLVLVLSEEGVPKNGNILYVNQETADGEGVTFDNVYPMEIGEENSYIYMSGTDLSYDKVGTIIPNVAPAAPEFTVEIIGAKNTATYSVNDDATVLNVVNEDAVCVVGYTTDDYATCTKLTATEAAEGYDFDISEVPGGAVIFIAIKGDTNSDGNVNTADTMTITRSLLQPSHGAYMTLSSFAAFVSDVTGEGTINTADTMTITRSLLQPNHAAYQLLKW